VEEPGDWSWNNDLPDLVPQISLQHSEPEVHWNESQWSERGGNDVPCPVYPVMNDAGPAMHVKILAQAIWVQLRTGGLCIVVPVSVPCVTATECQNEILLEKWRNWQRGDDELESVELAEEPCWLKQWWDKVIVHAITKGVDFRIDMPSAVESLLVLGRCEFVEFWLFTVWRDLD
jgi:hypothetical protein